MKRVIQIQNKKKKWEKDQFSNKINAKTIQKCKSYAAKLRRSQILLANSVFVVLCIYTCGVFNSFPANNEMSRQFLSGGQQPD